MSYVIDPVDGDIIIGGLDQGIGATPYTGLIDARSVNIGSVPGEASVSFSTSSASAAPVLTNNTTATLITTSSGLFSAPTSLALETNQYITFSDLGGASGSGLATATPYRLSYQSVSGANSLYQLFTTAGVLVGVSVASSTTVTFSTISPTTPKYFQQSRLGYNFMLDDAGNVWTSYLLTAAAGSIPSTSSWTWAKNTTGASSHGNGLIYWTTANATNIGDWDGWLFVFRDGQIDYSNVDGVNNGSTYQNVGTWVYQWSPVAGTTGSATSYLSGSNLVGCPHQGVSGPDGNMYFVDYFTTWKIEQFDKVTPVTFNPADNTTYIVTHAHNIPISEVATCIQPFGDNYIIGGAGNVAYVWNGVDQLAVTSYILLAESYVSSIIVVNTNAYIFCGNRGNIYVSNGSQANVWLKVPDHVTGLVEPNIEWGGTCYQKGRLYFGMRVTQNITAGGSDANCGGVWCADLDTQALWNSNQLSYGSYAGYTTALYSIPNNYSGSAPNFPITPFGYGLLIGWVNGSTYGIDTFPQATVPYTNGASYVITELLPIGTAYKPTSPSQIELKFSVPLAASETAQVLTCQTLGGSFTSWGTLTGDGTTQSLSVNLPAKDQKFQWIAVKVILTAISSSSTLNRLTQIRIIGSTVKDQVLTQPFTLQ